MSQSLASLCHYCKYYDRSPGGPWKCAAFPDEIPREIVKGEVEHTAPYPGDHSIQFELAEDRRESYEEHLRLVDRMKQRHKELIRQGIISE